MWRPSAQGLGLTPRPVNPARARGSLLVLYFLSGFTFSTWLSRLPSVRDALGLSSGGMGAILMIGSLGGLVMLIAAGPLVGRIGGRVCLNAGASLLVVAFAFITSGIATGSIVLVAAGVLINGMYNAVTNVPQNMESAAIERLFGRSILPQFHASFAIGSLTGSLAGAQLSALGVPASIHLAILVAIIAVVRFTAIRAVVVESNDAAIANRQARQKRTADAADDAQPEPDTGRTAADAKPDTDIATRPTAADDAQPDTDPDRAAEIAAWRAAADAAEGDAARAAATAAAWMVTDHIDSDESAGPPGLDGSPGSPGPDGSPESTGSPGSSAAARAGADSGRRPKRRRQRKTRSTALGAWLEGRTILIGVMAMAFSLSEGTASNWMPLSVVDAFDQSEARGALIFSIFQIGIVVMRWFGSRIIDRFGRVKTLRVSSTVCIAGLVLFAFAPQLWLAAIGAALWGLGAALNFPITLAAAADEPLRSAGRVSVVSAFATSAQLVAPPIIGMVGASIGLRHAFLGIVAFLMIAMVLSPAIRHTPLRRRG